MQQAICPLCGGVLTLDPQPQAQVPCPHCGGSLEAVMNGRAVILKEKKQVRQENPEALAQLEKAEKQPDPVKRHRLLQEGLEKWPDSLALNRALLMHGRLHERNAREIDYSVIKCYLLHPFEQPQEHPEHQRRAFYEELFNAPLLQKCMALSPDGEAFYQAYLMDLCAQYVTVFLKGNSRYMTSMFGIPLGKAEKNLSRPAAAMLRAMEDETLLSPKQKADLKTAFRAGYLQVLGSADYLDALL